MFRNFSDKAREFLLSPVSGEDITMFSLGVHAEDAGTQPVMSMKIEWRGADNSLVKNWNEIEGKGQQNQQKFSPLLTCAGPCERVLPVNEMRHFGRCEHNICAECLKNAPRDRLFPESAACPNVDCLVSELVEETIEEESNASLNTSSVFNASLRSCASCHSIDELIACKVLFVEKIGYKVLKNKKKVEWYGSTPLHEVRQRIASISAVPLTSLYFCSGILISRKLMQPFPQPVTEHILAELLEPGTGQLTFFAGFGVHV